MLWGSRTLMAIEPAVFWNAATNLRGPNTCSAHSCSRDYPQGLQL